MNRIITLVLCLSVSGFSNHIQAQEFIQIKQKILSSPNTTSHIFSIPCEKLKDTLMALFNKPFMQDDNPFLNAVFQHPSPSTLDTQRRYTYFRAAETPFFSYPDSAFDKPGTKDYVFMRNGNSWQSLIYYANGKALPYYAEFALKLQRIDTSHTLLSVGVLSPTVSFYETSWNECNCGIFPGGKSAYVDPTTIEEHAILQYLADKLHDATIEPLQMPVPVFVKKKHRLILFKGRGHRKAGSKNKSHSP